MFSMRDCSVCEYVLGSEKIVHVLVKFYNIIIKFNYYPEIWLKVADVMIEKGNDPRLKKFKILELIEACTQFIMRIFLGNIMENKVEEDKISSKHNYGSREGNFIEMTFLEKMLTFDYVKKTEDANACTISYLEACCDRQMPELCGVVEEIIWANRKAAKWITKELPRIKHYVGTANRTITKIRRDENELLEGTGQGNFFRSNMWRCAMRDI